MRNSKTWYGKVSRSLKKKQVALGKALVLKRKDLYSRAKDVAVIIRGAGNHLDGVHHAKGDISFL